MSDKTINQNYAVQLRNTETPAQALARTVTNPESLSASVLTICQNIERTQVNEMVDELRQQSAAIHNNDMSRAESMLIAQAHTLDGLFAKLASQALTSNDLSKFERYMKLALKAQSQSRATLQTLGEIKAPKQIAFVKQANIGNQCTSKQHYCSHAHAEKTKNAKRTIGGTSWRTVGHQRGELDKQNLSRSGSRGRKAPDQIALKAKLKPHAMHTRVV